MTNKTALETTLGKVDKGTTETRAKLTPDPIISLLKAGKLDLDHINAVDEIEFAYRLITHDLVTIKVHVMERMSPSYKGDHEPMKHSRSIRTFQSWANILDDKGIPLTQVLGVVVERKSPHSVDRSYSQRNGTALSHLIDGLEVYCQLRGWKNADHRALSQSISSAEK